MTFGSVRRTLFAIVALATACSAGTTDTADSESEMLAQRIFAAAGSSEEDALLRREQDVALAEAMAVCMNESGFDYIAYVAPEVTAAFYQPRMAVDIPTPCLSNATVTASCSQSSIRPTESLLAILWSNLTRTVGFS